MPEYQPPISNDIETAVVKDYLACACWLADDELSELINNSDKTMAELFAPEAIEQALSDWNEFLGRCVIQDKDMVNIVIDNEAQAQHDFWLTRNGHGAGFWDRPEEMYDGHQDKLSTIAESFGACGVYLGDDGLLYLN